MTHDDTDTPRNDGAAPAPLRVPSDDTILLLARELEWAEAYAADHPACAMGRLYLVFLRRELVTAQAHWRCCIN